jgi:non-specific protein-tyrosine kinase
VKVADLQRQINDADNHIASLSGNSDAVNTERQGAVAQRDGLVLQLGDLQRQLDQLELATNVKTGDAQVVAPAVASGVPISPRPKRDMTMALGLGLFLGCGLAFVVEYFDDSIRTKDDFERAVPSLPVLAMIPAVAGWRPKDDPRVVSISEPASPAAEAYRTLRTAVQFLGVDRPIRTLQVTSPNAHEGKTTTLSNLGVALARAGARVVIVCSDLRRPRTHEFFGLSNTVGFTSVLLGEVPLASALQRVPGVDRLYLLASGPLPPNPSELLQSRRALEVLQQLQSEGNFLLIDCPPILPVTDGLVISKRVQATLVVASARRTTRKEIGRTIELLRQVDAPLIGAVLNGVTPESAYGYAYEYYRASEYGGSNGSGSRNGNGSAAKNGSNGAVKRRRSAGRSSK